MIGADAYGWMMLDRWVEEGMVELQERCAINRAARLGHLPASQSHAQRQNKPCHTISQRLSTPPWPEPHTLLAYLCQGCRPSHLHQCACTRTSRQALGWCGRRCDPGPRGGRPVLPRVLRSCLGQPVSPCQTLSVPAATRLASAALGVPV